MTRSKLQQIAADMRMAVAKHETGWTAMQLPGGLEMVLSHQAEVWRLALRRERVYPSQTEEEILAQVFGVPEGTEVQRRSKKVPAQGRSVQWCVSEFIWREM